MDKRMDDDAKQRGEQLFLTITQAEEETGIPNGTLKRYMLNHSNFVEYKKVGREYRISVASIEVLNQIRSLYESGYKRDRVDEVLSTEGFPVTITLDSDSDSTELISMNEEMQEMRKMLEMVIRKSEEDKQIILNELHQARKEIAILKEKSDKDIIDLKHQLNRYESDRVKELHKISSSVSSLQEDARTVREEAEANNKGFFSKLFGK